MKRSCALPHGESESLKSPETKEYAKDVAIVNNHTDVTHASFLVT
jgi:hypothetical protein